MAVRNKKLSFLYNETGLLVSRREMVRMLAIELGAAPRLKRFLPGHGWGLKYLLIMPGETEPRAVLKAASRRIEKRLKEKLDASYLPPGDRFERECDILSQLAEIGLGPEVLLCRNEFFVREFIHGSPLTSLAAMAIARLMPVVLHAVESACAAGVYHTDLNAGNVIVRPDGRIGFIDCEIPRDVPTDDAGKDIARAYCHERLLSSLAEFNGDDDKLAAAVEEYYITQEHPPLSSSHALDLIRGEIQP